MGLELRTEQQLKISQKLLKSLEVLQMNEDQLFRYLSDTSESNPAMDFSWDDFSNSVRKPVSDDISQEDYIENIADVNQVSESFQEYLYRQIYWEQYNSQEKQILSFLIDNLDDEGYFRQSLEQAASVLNTDEETIQKMLKVIQSLEPAGVGARCLSECLFLQLEKVNGSELAQRIVKTELENLARRHYAQIATDLKATLPEVEKSCKQIAQLNPLPANSFCSKDSTVYIRPDVIITIDDGHLHCSLAARNMRLGVNEVYAKLFRQTQDLETKRFLKEKLSQAYDVVKQVEKRNDTLARIVAVILERQEQFFLSAGQAPCMPLGLNEIACALHLNPSTICRAIQNKYLECSSGTYPLKWFLKRTVQKNMHEMQNDLAVSEDMAKSLIAEIIRCESEEDPYSDARLAAQLCQRGIHISRRTINKYRTALRIADRAGRINQYRLMKGEMSRCKSL